MVNGKTIVLGVCGGIAAYKAVSLCSKLVQSGAHVRVVMTKSATRFVTPLTLQTISRHAVYTDTFEERDPEVVSHIELADAADLVVIAPATANMIAKMAYGIADDMLSTTLLAAQAPVVVAPAMNVHMYAHPAVQHNMRLLAERGALFVEPGVGQLACGYVGKGRLAEPEELFAYISDYFRSREQSGALLLGKRIVITAGGTVERIDPVRYITNDSSGKMGFAIAEAAQAMGADVTLIYGNVSEPPPAGIRSVHIGSAADMYEAVMVRLADTDILVKAAAVADYRPQSVLPQKMKKSESTVTLTLERNPDILKAAGERKTTQFIVGFAAETERVEEYALKKLREKRCDLIVANDVSRDGAGFGSDTNIVQVFDQDGLVEAMPQMSKREVANRLLKLIAARVPSGGGGK